MARRVRIGQGGERETQWIVCHVYSTDEVINLLVDCEAGQTGCQARFVGTRRFVLVPEVAPDCTGGLLEIEIVDGLEGPVDTHARHARATCLR